MQFHARGVAVFLLAIVADAEVASGDTFNRTVFVEQHFAGSKAREDLYAQTFRLLGQPAAQVAQRNNIVAFVVHGLRHEQARHLDGLVGIGHVEDFVFLHGDVDRRAQLFPVREQLVQRARLQYRTGEDMGADLGAFLDHDDADFLAGFPGDLAQTAGGGKPGRAGTDDDYIDFHRFAFHSLLLVRLRARQGRQDFRRRAV